MNLKTLLSRSGWFVCLLLISVMSAHVRGEAFTVTNPLIEQRADAQIYRHNDGYYYFTATVPAYDRIILRRAKTIQGLSTAEEVTIWTKHSEGIMGAHIWAPEIHFIDGKWYVYFAAGASNAVWAIRMYVLENNSADPFTAAWIEKGQIETNNWKSFSLDATTFVHRDTRYLVWAQKDPAIKSSSNLYIAKMANPWTIVGTPVMLTQPTHAWERAGIPVNEGPAVLIRNGRVFMAYSAAKTDASYCLGLLTASADSDLLDVKSWIKSPAPVLRSGNGVYGPGHNQFTTSDDGKRDLLVYHGRDYEEIKGDPLKDPNRHTRIQELTWNPDGSPHFGEPVANGPLTIATQTPPVSP